MKPLKAKLSYLSLKEGVPTQKGLWDNSHIESRVFFSSCCQAAVDTSGSECFCTGCGETISQEELLEQNEEQSFYREDYQNEVKGMLSDMADYN